MKNVLLGSLLCSVFLFVSCHKSMDESKTTSQLSGKWYLKKWTANDVSGGVSRPSSDTYDPGDYLQFNSGGQLLARVDSENSQGTWQLLNNNKNLLINSRVLDTPDEGFDIRTLTASNLVLYVKEVSGTSYSETTIYLEK